MSNIFFKLAIFVVATPVVIYMNNANKVSAMEAYNITPAEESVFKDCRSGMIANDLSFKGGASDNKGCACMTKQASHEFTPKQFAIAGDVVGIKLDLAEKQKELKNDKKAVGIMMDAIEKLEALQTSSKLTENQFMKVLDKTTDYVQLCGSRKNHTEENVSKWAAYSIRGVPKERRKVASAAPKPSAPKLRK